jgi:starch-binding outer membrane protein, SusD/RagB family
MIQFFIKKGILTKAIFKVCMLTLSLCISSCEDFIAVPPPATELVQENVFKDDATALAAMASVYSKLSDGDSFADGDFNSITLVESLYGDELNSFMPVASTTPRVEFYFNSVSPLNAIVSSTWSRCYTIIYECNRMLEGLDQSVISATLKSQLSGEARFIRAFCHFYLVNLFGAVPLITTSDYRVTSKASRTSVTEVYADIITDLKEAKALLTDTYPSADRVRVNRGAAIALLARSYLYSEDFTNAEAQATEMINKTLQYKLATDLNNVFLKTSEEAIWQLLPKGGAQNYTNEASLFILLAPPTRWALSNAVYEAFEPDDLRKIDWIGSITSSSGLTTWYYPFKYKENALNASGAEYSMVLRLAEQYLIRAEARAQLDKLIGENSASSDLNAIRTRAGLPNTTASSKEELLLAIEQERRVELFTEWGHRFFDLKRAGRLNTELSPIKVNWDDTDALLPLPQNELLLNSNLKPQNPGY